jgi:hypothetical protein
MFESSGWISMVANGGTTVRTATGVVTVRFPVVGAKVEAAIVSGLHDHAEREAEVLEGWVASDR